VTQKKDQGVRQEQENKKKKPEKKERAKTCALQRPLPQPYHGSPGGGALLHPAPPYLYTKSGGK
jgi:hypothetical protein